MIDVDISEVYSDAHGKGAVTPPSNDPFAPVSMLDGSAVRAVCRGSLELRQAYCNLRDAIDACGDCVRISVPDAMRADSSVAIAAALMDGADGWRRIYIDVADHDALDGSVCRTLHDAEGVGDYIRRVNMRLEEADPLTTCDVPQVMRELTPVETA